MLLLLFNIPFKHYVAPLNDRDPGAGCLAISMRCISAHKNNIELRHFATWNRKPLIHIHEYVKATAQSAQTTPSSEFAARKVGGQVTHDLLS